MAKRKGTRTPLPKQLQVRITEEAYDMAVTIQEIGTNYRMAPLYVVISEAVREACEKYAPEYFTEAGDEADS